MTARALLVATLFTVAPAPGWGAADRGADGRIAAGAAPATGTHIVVDQFGYLPGDPKVAVVRNPRRGYDVGAPFEPGARYEVVRERDDAVVLAGAPAAWSGGAVQDSSGDQGWWFDFSAVTAPGRYHVRDARRGARSPSFSIGEDVYRPVLRAALRTFYYQRSGIAKTQRHAGACWTDDAAFLGPGQDGEARDVRRRDDPASARDLRGGWFDAGDTNKYVTYAAPAVHQLLAAYEQHPAAFGDDLGIPESGNGVPDVVDEVRWEIAWLVRMQEADGGVALKVGTLTDEIPSPPGADRRPRYYLPACTSSTIAAAGMFAHAAVTFGRFPALRAEARELGTRAARAFDRFVAAPALQTDCDDGTIRAGDADLAPEVQQGEAAVAAAYLYELTGEPRWAQELERRHRQARPYRDAGWSRYEADQGEALLRFAALPGAPAALARRILDDKLADVRGADRIYGWRAGDDLYRAFLHDEQYHWGSNQVRANYGNTNLDVPRYLPAAGDPAPYRQRALETLHYLHGVNPLGLAYLTNMRDAGAARSASAIYHSWFQAGTRWARANGSDCGPPPGYVPAGPNASAEANGVPASLAPPTGQPAQKSYRDWNGNWPESSWAVTEPAIYYQAAYVKLLAAFVR